MTVSRQEIRERRRRQKKQQRVTTTLIVAGMALIFAAILMIPAISDALRPAGGFITPPLNPRPMADGNAMGDPNAPVVIEAFSDFGCGHCGTFALETGEEITQNYVVSGDVYLIYRSSGSMLGHPNTSIAAEAAYCAGDQNKFWEFHDLIYSNQAALFAQMDADIEDALSGFADYLGLDMAAYENCFDSHKYRDRVQQDGLDAQQAGVNSTPSFLINGRMVVGNRPYEEFQALIEAELAKTGN